MKARKVGEHDPVYQKAVGEARERARRHSPEQIERIVRGEVPPSGYIFGQELFDASAANRDKMRSFSRAQFRQLFRHEEDKHSSIVNNTRAQSLLRGLLQGQASLGETVLHELGCKGESIENMAGRLRWYPDRISNHTYDALIDWHGVSAREERLLWEAQLPALRENFLERLLTALDQEEVSIDVSKLRQRSMGTPVQFEDPWFFPSQYHPVTATAHVRISEFPKRTEISFAHEMMHALSGRTMIETQSSDEAVVNQKLGFAFRRTQGRDFLKEISPPRFQWLNEAITDYLTRWIRGSTTGYEKEEELFSLLQKNGQKVVPRRLFLQAYFENYTPANQEGQRVSAWNQLSTALEEAYPSAKLVAQKKGGRTSILVAIDTFIIKRDDIPAVIEILETDWRKLYNAA